jgi:hypothetical protein
LSAIHYNARRERPLIDGNLGTFVITGPKVLEFYDDFCSLRATPVKADAKNILSVTMILNAERNEETKAWRS